MKAKEYLQQVKMIDVQIDQDKDRQSEATQTDKSKEQISKEIEQKFPQKRPLYLLEAAIPRFTGINLDKIADNLRKAGKEVYYIPEDKYR